MTVDVSGLNATLEQAAKMADAALKRIEKPLPVDAAEGIAAATARAAARPAERDPCGLVSRAEAEAALGTPLAKDRRTGRPNDKSLYFLFWYVPTSSPCARMWPFIARSSAGLASEPRSPSVVPSAYSLKK